MTSSCHRSPWTSVRGAIALGLVLCGDAASAQARPGAGGVRLPDHRREAVQLAGAVARVEPWQGVPGVDGFWLVEVAGGGDPGRRSFVVAARTRASLPIVLGDVIDASIDCTRHVWHYVCDAVIRDASGALLVASSGSGRPDLVPEWTVRGPAAPRPPRSGTRTFPLVFEHLGVRKRASCRGWSRLVAADGVFLVSGCARVGAPAAVRASESGNYATYSISRVR